MINAIVGLILIILALICAFISGALHEEKDRHAGSAAMFALLFAFLGWVVR